MAGIVLREQSDAGGLFIALHFYHSSIAYVA